MTVGRTDRSVPHLNSVCRGEAADQDQDQDQDLACSKHVGFVMLALCRLGASGPAGKWGWDVCWAALRGIGD